MISVVYVGAKSWHGPCSTVVTKGGSAGRFRRACSEGVDRETSFGRRKAVVGLRSGERHEVENPRRVGSPGTDQPSLSSGETPKDGGEGHSEALARKFMGGGGVQASPRREDIKTLEGMNPRRASGSGRSKPPVGATDFSGGARP